MQQQKSHAKPKIGILGLGKTGVSCFKYFKNQADVICFDDNKQAIASFAAQFSSACIADLTSPQWQSINYLIVSPGVALNYPKPHALIQIAQRYNIPLINEVEILYQNNSDSRFIAITGTNGKSTTTALLDHVLKDYGYSCGGNIGTPCLDLAKNNGYILELSSYQLDLLTNFKPRYACITNITPDHLDRYASMNDYIDSKLSISKNMDKSDYLVINIDDPVLNDAKNRFKHTNIISISTKNKSADIYYHKSQIFDQLNVRSFELEQNPNLKGEHNIYNILSSYAICSKTSLSAEQILTKINTFKGINHRLEFIGAKKFINFYNDSKATNAQASGFDLQALDNIFWLAGGIAKTGGISSIIHLTTKVKKAYLFGQDRYKLAQDLTIPTFICQTLEQALAQAMLDAQDFADYCNILLSPACASFDQFENFEQRGNYFTNLVRNYL